MLNQTVLVGRICRARNPEEIKNVGYKYMIQIPNGYEKNKTDLIPFVVKKGIYEKMSEYCADGDVIGVKGKLEIINDNAIVIAEKVTFLSSNQKGASTNVAD